MKDLISMKDFLENYSQIILIDVAEGAPSADTQRTYMSQVHAWVSWCEYHGIAPLQASTLDIRTWRSELIQGGYSSSSTTQKISIVRRLYQSALDRGLIAFNPAAGIRSSRQHQIEQDENIKYLTLGQMELLLHTIPKTEAFGRDYAMIALMLLQGLRTVEVYRSCVEHYDTVQNILTVKGKGKNGKIYPRADVKEAVLRYLDARDAVAADDKGIPLFVAIGNRAGGSRLSRHGIRQIVDRWLLKAGLKHPGVSCHAMRHSCGTQVYSVTKDIRLTQEELRHSSPETTAKYAHVINRQARRATEEIPIKI